MHVESSGSVSDRKVGFAVLRLYQPPTILLHQAYIVACPCGGSFVQMDMFSKGVHDRAGLLKIASAAYCGRYRFRCSTASVSIQRICCRSMLAPFVPIGKIQNRAFRGSHFIDALCIAGSKCGAVPYTRDFSFQAFHSGGTAGRRHCPLGWRSRAFSSPVATRAPATTVGAAE